MIKNNCSKNENVKSAPFINEGDQEVVDLQEQYI